MASSSPGDTPNDISVRPAVSADLPGLCRLYSEMLGRPIREDASGGILDAITAQVGHTLFVAEDQDEAVGTVAMIIVPSLIGAPSAFLETLFVRAGQRRRGVARMLVMTAVDHARSAGCFGVNLLSGRGNAEAHRLFEDVGFEAASRGFILYFPHAGKPKQ